ncbi:cold shock-induced protein Tir2p [Monosporozyma unispora]|nr:hypothetical protein C6P44_001972 [Kazachstania unispora]
MVSKTTIVFSSAITAAAAALTETQDKQLDIIFADVGKYIDQYISLVSDSSSGITMDNLPSGLIDIGEEVATNPDDTSYTTLYSEVDMAAVSSFVTKVSWYSSRIEPALKSAGVPIEGSSGATTTSTSEATTTSVSSSKVQETSSTVTSKAISNSGVTPSSSSAISTNSVNSIISSTSPTIELQSGNGANSNGLQLGAGAFAAIAFLL